MVDARVADFAEKTSSGAKIAAPYWEKSTLSWKKRKKLIKLSVKW